MGAIESVLQDGLSCQGLESWDKPSRVRSARPGCCRTEDGDITDIEDCPGFKVYGDSSPKQCPLHREDGSQWQNALGRPVLDLDFLSEPVDKQDGPEASEISNDDRVPASNARRAWAGPDLSSAEHWIGALREGVVLSLDDDQVHVTLDTELGGLEVLEHGLLFPLAELSTFYVPPTGRNRLGYQYFLSINFAEFDTLLFQFAKEEERKGFKAAVDQLIQDAREGRFPEWEVFDGYTQHLDDQVPLAPVQPPSPPAATFGFDVNSWFQTPVFNNSLFGAFGGEAVTAR